MSAGIYLETLRERQHVSRQELAKKLKVSVQTISNIENGKKEPRGSLLFAVIDALGASYEDMRELLQEKNDEHRAYQLAERRLMEAQQRLQAEISDPRGTEIADRILNDPDFRAMFERKVQDALRR